MTPNRTATRSSRRTPPSRRPTVKALGEGDAPRPRAQQGLARALGSAARHPAAVDLTGPARRRRQRRARTRPTACSATRATPATSWCRRRSPTRTPAAATRTPSPTPRPSSTRRRHPCRRHRASSSSPSTASSTPRRESVYGLIPLSQVKALANGTHHVFVRGQDAAGNWGALFGGRPGRRQDGAGARSRDRHAQPDERGGDADPHRAGRRDVLRGRRVLARQHRPRRREGHPGAGQPVARTSWSTVPLAGIAVGPSRSTCGCRTSPATGATRSTPPSR